MIYIIYFPYWPIWTLLELAKFTACQQTFYDKNFIFIRFWPEFAIFSIVSHDVACEKHFYGGVYEKHFYRHVAGPAFLRWKALCWDQIT